ncbi:MAG: hypothetical protein BGO68_02775 [Candidatus Amoebophilus sp. 36-38]|nr:MAG: hypothetical protein BGO68_02775 [Candidatus Amoebophilus sp. 36-38]
MLEGKFEYQGIPFSKVERCNVEPQRGTNVGEFLDKSESIDKMRGSYRVIYKLDTKFMKFATSSKSPYSKDNDRFRREIIKQIKIRIYIKKKDQSNNKIRIEQINQELLQQQRHIEAYNQEIEEVENSRKTTEALIDHYTTDLENQKTRF